MKYHFLLLDADCTLLDFPKDMEEAFLSMYSACFATQRPFSPQLLAQYNACNVRAWIRFEQGLCSKQELFISRFVEFLDETGLQGSPEAINSAYFTALAQTGTPYPGAVDLLAELSKFCKIYIVTNGNVVSQMPRLEHSGLMPYLQDVFVSEAVGVGKPHKAYFDYAAAHIPGFEPRQAVVIGDSLSSDIQGAANAGLDSIWYTGALSDPAVPSQPLYTCRADSYSDILRILKDV